jgi:phosphoribosylglycinamide formyltransferase-1
MRAKGKSNRLRVAVLVSGGGTNLQALIDRSVRGELKAEIVVVASDRPDAFGLVRAARANIPHHTVDYSSILQPGSATPPPDSIPVDLMEIDGAQKILRIADPQLRLERLQRIISAEHQLIGRLDRYEPELVCLAGFMRLVSPYFIRHYNREGAWRVLNIHPALLPAFPGQHGYEDTFRYGCRWGGVTVHYVDEGEDTGPIIAQGVYPVWPNDTLEETRQRGLALEYEIYAQCINWAADGFIEMNTTQIRPVTRITDPAYPQILAGWTRKSLLLTP